MINAFFKNKSYILIAVLFILGTTVSLFAGISVRSVMKGFSYDVLVILIVMELFTNLITETGIMQFVAIRMADISKGSLKKCLILFGGLMFIISSLLNNITAVMMILPVIFVLFNALEIDRRYVWTFFAVILALSNTGGAASPIGDFPAVVIMTSGITSFSSYLIHAFPLFAMTSALIISFWSFIVRKESEDDGIRKLAVSNLKSQYKNNIVRKDVLIILGVVFACMFLAWSLIDQNTLPPEIIAVLGYVVGMSACVIKGIRIKCNMDLKSVLTIASFVFVAQVVSQTGILSGMATFLQANITNPKYLVLAIMCITSLVSGVCSAGPAAAALMPIIVDLCEGPLKASSDWVAIAYAASICAGSSLFMWSATAGFILSGKVNDAGIEDDKGKEVSWGVVHYLKYGFVNYAIQLSIALAVMALVL